MVIAISLDRSDPWQTRLAIANALQQMAPTFSAVIVRPFFEFLIGAQACKLLFKNSLYIFLW